MAKDVEGKNLSCEGKSFPWLSFIPHGLDVYWQSIENKKINVDSSMVVLKNANSWVGAKGENIFPSTEAKPQLLQR